MVGERARGDRVGPSEKAVLTADIDRSSESPVEPDAGKGPVGWLQAVNKPIVRWLAFLAALAALVATWGLARKSVVIGVVSDAPLVLAAIGFALLYRLTGLINVAYSETVTMGAYLGMWVNTTFGLSFYVTLIPTALLAGLFSVATYFAIFRPAKLRNVGVVETIIISFGLSVFLRYGLQFIFGFEFRYYDVPVPKSLSVLGVGVSPFRLTALGSALGISLLLVWFIRKSRLGVQIRALAGDEKLAQASGINPLATTMLIWFIAGMAGGLAGAFYGVNTSCRAWLGWDQFLFILLVVLIGGAKGIGGVVIAGLATGVSLSFLELMPGLNTTPVYAQVIVIALFVVILKVRGNRLVEAGKV
jgi:branched-chain amino acid transport system permease protein